MTRQAFWRAQWVIPNNSSNLKPVDRIFHSNCCLAWNDWNDLFLFYFDSKFEIKTTVHKQAEWREKSRGGAVSRKVMK